MGNCWTHDNRQSPRKVSANKEDVVRRDADLLMIRNHPNRIRRRSSIAPSTPRIKEDQILEDLCQTTGVEPEVPADTMNKRDVKQLIRRISTSDAFTQQFNSELDFLQYLSQLRATSSTAMSSGQARANPNYSNSSVGQNSHSSDEVLAASSSDKE
uniref:Uncharacterized protein LOC100181536 n=1 Tax=Phallusia mammillata TaxID=59560 RepID=A0A6F9DGT2_9ASCI|nr:uncharacterized protein LOC100181536 [Phallusia mammillata]